ncbi:MAG: acyl-ACP desaturase [bacterium]|nr:acyl-ACP desaturase [bacterium]
MAETHDIPDLKDSDEMFLHELTGRIGELANAHIESEKEYFPYDFADEIDQAVADGNLDLDSDEAQITPIVRNALFVNLLTEEGLPYYTSTIQSPVPLRHPIREWSHLWTADEGRHGPTIANFLHKTRQFSMRELERARNAMMRNPDTPQPESFIESIVYPAIQEPATEISHRNTLKLLPRVHKIGRRAIGFVIGDEVRHGKFYKEASVAAMEVDPSLTVVALARQIRGFAMPGKSIPGFDERANEIANAGIFGPEQLKTIYDDLLNNHLRIWHQENFTPAAEKAREFLNKRMRQMEIIIRRRQSKLVQS